MDGGRKIPANKPVPQQGLNQNTNPIVSKTLAGIVLQKNLIHQRSG
jgi:hypothetical protein